MERDETMEYKFRFNGRHRGAIGIFHPIEATAYGDTVEDAFISLYDRYEHLTAVRFQDGNGDWFVLIAKPGAAV